MSGKKGNKTAAEYIKKKFDDKGLSAEYDKFNIKRVNPGPKNEIGDDFTQNIYAVLEGNDPVLKDEVVVIGAHMDHIGYGPTYSRTGGGRIHNGADDNASGTAALIEMAEALSAMKGQNKRTIVLMAFSAEEMGLLGSIHYVNNPKFPKGNPNIKKHIFMLNMDMIGYLGKSKTVAFDDGSSSPDIGFIIKQLTEKYSIAKNVTLRGSGGSDHAPFYNKRVPIAFLHTGLHEYYHTPRDTADKINYEGLEKVARYGFELAWTVCNAVERVEFDYGSFKEMDLLHDHGQKDMPLEEMP
jgi:Zn-dependent M28 family amino/carboxypeptidase